MIVGGVFSDGERAQRKREAKMTDHQKNQDRQNGNYRQMLDQMNVATLSIEALKERVVEAAKSYAAGYGDGVAAISSGLAGAVSALRAAEEAAKRPRLLAPWKRLLLASPPGYPMVNRGDAIMGENAERAIEARDAEWLAALRARAAPMTQDVVWRGVPASKNPNVFDIVAVPLADIEALAATAKP